MNRKTISLGLMAILTVAAFSLAACGDGDKVSAGGETPVSTPTVEVSDPETGPSGIPSVDEGIDALIRNDSQTIIDLIVLESLACVTDVQGMGGPPECGTGEAAGTKVDVVLFASCEGYFVREHQLERTLARFTEGDIELHGVYGITGRAFVGAKYVAVFAAEREEGTLAQALYFTDQGIVGVDYGCGQQPDQYAFSGNFTHVIVAPV